MLLTHSVYTKEWKPRNLDIEVDVFVYNPAFYESAPMHYKVKFSELERVVASCFQFGQKPTIEIKYFDGHTELVHA